MLEDKNGDPVTFDLLSQEYIAIDDEDEEEEDDDNATKSTSSSVFDFLFDSGKSLAKK